MLETVNGLKVVDIKDSMSPLSTPEKPIRFRTSMVLVLEDGTEVYACSWDGCDFTAEKPQAVFGHYKAHRPSTPKRWNELAEWTLTELLETILDFEETLNRLTTEKVQDKSRIQELRTRTVGLSNKVARRDATIAELGAEVAQLHAQLQKLKDEYSRNAKDLDAIRRVFGALNS